jgi:fructan beta-fructosidase
MRSIWRDEDPNGTNPLRVVVNPGLLNLGQGDKEQLTAAVIPLGSKQKVKWVSTDESVASVASVDDISAEVTGMKEGKAEIEAISEDGSVAFSINVFVEGK